QIGRRAVISATSDAVGSDIRQIDGAHGGLVRAKPEKCRISTDFFIRDDRSDLPTTDRRKKPVINLRFNIKRLSMQLSHRIGPGIRDRPTQIWPHLPALLASLATAVCGGCHSIIYPVHARRYRGSAFSPVRMKEHDV